MNSMCSFCVDNSFNQMDMEYEKSSTKTRYSSSVPVNVPLMNRSRVEMRGRLLHDDESIFGQSLVKKFWFAWL